jgi:hypothetical protein
MRKITVIVASVTLALTMAACGVNPGTDNPLPQGTVATQSDEPADTTEDTPKATSCDVAREAILTGSAKEIKAAMKALVKDKKADATAREAAQDYLNETDKDLKQMSVDLVQMACSI